MTKLIIFIWLLVTFLFNLNINAQYYEIKSGIYINPETVNTPDEIMLKVNSDSLSIYRSMRGILVIDGHGPIVNSDANIVAECKLTPVGCSVYELGDTLTEYKLFQNMSIYQSGCLGNDSINVEIIFTKFRGSWINFNVSLIPWNKTKTVSKTDSVKFTLKPGTKNFYIALMPEKCEAVTDWYYNQLGPMKYMYNKPIQVNGTQITITIPNNVNGIFYRLNVAGEYLRQVSPGVIKWRGQFYFLNPGLTKMYLNN